ncbi:hypothetical protein C2G38_2141120 [Gigaspora rosea]|uniref:Phosphatidylglycerol/phosphatidylinositol transfer protein n=1 Tax=Gigaspora rosea TaxID=44941 RepID=A0A397VDJ4_9GLOM|nr:hypothetical protein C2G38_2141120 [Gigaspora rosea]
MFKFTVFLIFMIFISPSISEDLSGFVECESTYTFPIKITHFAYEPELIVANRSLKLEMGGISTVTIEKGAEFVNMVYRDDILTKIHAQDFCKIWVEPSGGHCPVEPGKFYFEWNLLASSIPQIDPINTNITEFPRITIVNPSGYILACIEGSVVRVYP